MSINISICIATYKRAEGLSKLLDAVSKLEFRQGETPSIEVIVIDNDAAGSAQLTCSKFKENFKWPLIYDLESQQGVSYARNRAVAKASTEADFIAFIDDDEVPEPFWIDELLAAQRHYEADIVAGPVYPNFEDSSVPRWIQAGGFFQPPQHETGKILNSAFTNNALVKAELLRQLEIIFDPRFAIKGSEDTHLFMRLRKLGARILWTRSAIVHETIPSNRTTLSWLLKRNFWGWSSYSLFEKEIFPSIKLRIVRFLKGLSLLLMGLILIPPYLLIGRRYLYQSLIITSRGMGTLAGLMSIQGNW